MVAHWSLRYNGGHNVPSRFLRNSREQDGDEMTVSERDERACFVLDNGNAEGTSDLRQT